MQGNNYKQPKIAVIAITYKCNSKCQMCNIWQKQPKDEVKPSIYLKLPRSLNDINITGGEPFLRPDMIEILDHIFARCHPPKLDISSNGFLTDKIIAISQEILKRKYKDKVAINLSLDGIGEVHDKIRGIAHAYNKVITTIKGLKSIGFNNISIGFTFMAGNEAEFEKVYNVSKELNLNFGATIAHNADNYYSTHTNTVINADIVKEQINNIINEKIKSYSKTELGKCYYLHGLVYFNETHKAILPCDALSGTFFLDPYGDVYPCIILSNKIGNLTNNDFNKIWQSELANSVRSIVKNCHSPCWTVCTGKPAIKRHWYKASLWLFKQKIISSLRFSQ